MTFATGSPLGIDDLGSAAWQTYTSTVSGIAVGSSVTSRYRRYGETYDVEIVISHAGATTGQITVTLPATMSVLLSWTVIGQATYIDTSATKRYRGEIIAPSSSFNTGFCVMQSALNGQMVAATTLPDGAAYATGDTTSLKIRCSTS
jgi:hypothetical protein